MTEAKKNPAQCCIHKRKLPCGMCLGMLPLIAECVRGKSSSRAVLCFAISTLPKGKVGECYLSTWKCVRCKSSSNAMLRFKLLRSQLETRWGMLPLIMKCVRGKSSSSAVLCFAISMVPFGKDGVCYLWTWTCVRVKK